MLNGSIDSLTVEGANGWFYWKDAPSPPVIRAMLNHEVIGAAPAEIFRADLKEAGFGDGYCGFAMKFTRPIQLSDLAFVVLRPQQVELNLAHTHNNHYIDLVRSLIGHYVGVGRTRSLLGGLWIDRTDAQERLASRTRVGSIPGTLKPALLELILNGFLVLPEALEPAGVTSAELTHLAVIGGAGPRPETPTPAMTAALASLAKLLFREPVVTLMRAIFDDHPVVYRLDAVEGTGAYGQLASLERLPAPAECLALYAGHPAAPIRLDVVRGSHELAEISPNGRSRWTAEGASDLAKWAGQAGLSVDSVNVGPKDLVLVGPGLVHRYVSEPNHPGLRALCAPRRVTPTRFLSGDGNWIESNVVMGARIRV